MSTIVRPGGTAEYGLVPGTGRDTDTYRTGSRYVFAGAAWENAAIYPPGKQAALEH